MIEYWNAPIIQGTELLPWHDRATTVRDRACPCMTTRSNLAFTVLPELNAVCLPCNYNNYRARLSLASDPLDMFNNHVNTSGNSNITLIILLFIV